jgi:hypothetical protein
MPNFDIDESEKEYQKQKSNSNQIIPGYFFAFYNRPPRNKLIINAPIKLNTFLINANRIPKYSFSTGKVSMPTIINVVMNVARTVYDTPLLRSIPAKGYAMGPGIRAIDPINAAIPTPRIPDSCPKRLARKLCDTKAKKALTRVRSNRN